MQLLQYVYQILIFLDYLQTNQISFLMQRVDFKVVLMRGIPAPLVGVESVRRQHGAGVELRG